MRSLLCPVLFVALFVAAARAEEKSLLDPAEARLLTRQEQRIFGPKSSGGRYDARMIRAAQIATERAKPKKTWYCWRYVKNALLAAGLVSTRPVTAWAKQAGDELCKHHGFVQLNLRDPKKAPVGSVIVYGGPDAGHVELRTREGYVSDFVSKTPYPRPLVGIFIKPA